MLVFRLLSHSYFSNEFYQIFKIGRNISDLLDKTFLAIYSKTKICVNYIIQLNSIICHNCIYRIMNQIDSGIINSVIHLQALFNNSAENIGNINFRVPFMDVYFVILPFFLSTSRIILKVKKDTINKIPVMIIHNISLLIPEAVLSFSSISGIVSLYSFYWQINRIFLNTVFKEPQVIFWGLCR